MNKFIYKNQLWNYINLYIFGEYAALDDMLSIRKCNQVKNENMTTTTKSYHIEPHLKYRSFKMTLKQTFISLPFH